MIGLLVANQTSLLTEWWPWVTVSVFILGEVISLLFFIRLLQEKSSPAATVSWTLIIFLAPYVGLLLYYLLPRRLHRRRLQIRAQRNSGIAETIDAVNASNEDLCDPSDAVIQLLHKIDPSSDTAGNAVEILPSGQQFVAQAARAIDGAQSSIHLVTYIFRPDATGKALLQKLTAAARRGVTVRVLYDNVGSWSLKTHHLAELHAAGGHSQSFLPIFWSRRPFTLNLRNHRKMLLIDGQLAFVGGRNIGDEYARDIFGKSKKWLDCMVSVRGPAVGRLQQIFVEDWHFAADENVVDESLFPDLPPVGDHPVVVIEGGPDRQTNSLHWLFFQLLASAREHVHISSPYLIPNATLLTALTVAAARGVKVCIHTNGREAEHTLLYWAKRANYADLLQAGVQITETNGDYNHSKMITVDKRYLFVGSPNLDVRSEELNFEVGVLAISPSLCRDAIAMFENREKDGKRIAEADLPDGRLTRLKHGIGRLLSPLL